MKRKKVTGLQISGTTTRIGQLLSQLRLAETTAKNLSCQICAESFSEGDPITVYLYKPVGSPQYTIGQCRCQNHNEGLFSLFTLGVRELIVDGRVGLCRDHATQQTWPVLIAPSIRLISAPDTTSGRVVRDREITHPNDHQQGQTTDCDSDKPDSLGGCHPSPSLLDRDDNTKTTVGKSTGRTNDG